MDVADRHPFPVHIFDHESVLHFQHGGLLLGTLVRQTIVPQARPIGKSGEFYLGRFGDFTIGRDTCRPHANNRLGAAISAPGRFLLAHSHGAAP